MAEPLDRTRLANDWVGIWNNKLDLIPATISENFTSHAAPLMGGAAGTTVGRDSLGEWVSGIHGVLEGLRFEIEVGPIVENALMVLRWKAESTYRGGLPGASDQAVGKEIKFFGTDTLRVENDLIAEYWANADSLWVIQQLGFSEVPVLG